jgi:EsV-1-7 cysteine-rich motif
MSKQIPQSCAKHKTPAMVDVLSARCVEEGCEKTALFGVGHGKVSTVHVTVEYSTQHFTFCCAWSSHCWLCAVLLVQTRLYCSEHAAGRPGLKNRGVGVSCTNEACSKTAKFGYPGQRALYCKTCIPAKLKMQLVDVVSRRCEQEGCDKQPNFGSPADRVSVASSSWKYR